MKTQYETILVNNHDRWVRLILNRPDVKNALSEKMTTELLSVLENIKDCLLYTSDAADDW